MSTPRVHTYHCTCCSQLLLASTHLFTALPTRHAPAQDRAIIVPLPKSSKPSEDSDEEMDEAQASGGGSGYTLLLTVVRDRAAKVVAREDGFEKRVLWRCGRCRVVVAYMLDDRERKGVDHFLYVLPAAVTESHELGSITAATPVELV